MNQSSEMKWYIKDSLSLLIKTKPNNVFDFLSDYFEQVHVGKHVLFKNFNYINAIPRNRKALYHQFKLIYKYINHDEEISIEEFYQLIILLCDDFPYSMIRNASRIVDGNQAPMQIIKFGEFTNQLFLLLFYAEFLNAAAFLFRVLDDKQSGYVNTHIFINRLLELINEKQNEFSCPDMEIIKTLNINTTTVMFNSICLSIFQHPEIFKELNSFH